MEWTEAGRNDIFIGVQVIKTYTFQCDRFSVIKEYASETQRTLYHVVTNAETEVDKRVSRYYSDEKEAMAFIIQRLENRLTDVHTSLMAHQLQEREHQYDTSLDPISPDFNPKSWIVPDKS